MYVFNTDLNKLKLLWMDKDWCIRFFPPGSFPDGGYKSSSEFRPVRMHVDFPGLEILEILNHLVHGAQAR